MEDHKNTLLEDTLSIAGRELAIFRSNLRTNLIRSAIFPFVILLFFGNLGQTVSKVPMDIVNYAGNVQASQFINTLQLSTTLYVQSITDQQTALQNLNNGAINFVVVILPSFPHLANGNPSVVIYYSSGQLTLAQETLPAIQNAVNQFTAQKNNYQATTYLPQQQIQSSQAVPIGGAGGNYKDFLFGGIIPMVVIFGSMFGTGMSLITDRQFGNLKTFLVAPINKNAIVLGKLVAGALQSVLYAVIAIIVGVALGSSIAMGIVGLIPIILIAMILSVGFTSLAIMLATRIKKVEVFAIASQVFALPTWFLSGGILPTQALPSWLYPISVINPATYAVEGLRDVIVQGVYPLNTALWDFAILGVFVIIMVLLSMRMFKSTIE